MRPIRQRGVLEAIARIGCFEGPRVELLPRAWSGYVLIKVDNVILLERDDINLAYHHLSVLEGDQLVHLGRLAGQGLAKLVLLHVACPSAAVLDNVQVDRVVEVVRHDEACLWLHASISQMASLHGVLKLFLS